MASDRPDPADFLEMAQRALRQFFGDQRGDDSPADPFTGRSGARPVREPSPQEQRENLTFALATRAVEALEDVALNVAAIRQRLERLDAEGTGAPSSAEGDGAAAPEG
ncbi:hypothetical protein [Blastococcus sp. URHD0036]|uniref:hypothetical protein n=1 Tax=Blastococcus sp. URHD0036 TaxID=1380356 RepID=UPI0004966AF7|nr:hypothetical protein [Blastococcus sp. URHD0036]